MTVERIRRFGVVLAAAVLALAVGVPAQQAVTETRDPAQQQDDDFAKAVKEWTTQPFYTSPLVDHLPRVAGVPMPKDVLGYHVGAPAKLTYYADILKYYRALAAASPRVKVETIGKSDEDRELVVIWIASDENMKSLQKNRENLAKIADPRGLTPEQIKQLIATTKPHYHLMGGLHSGETGPSEMLMELAYRLVTETSPLIKQIRENVIVSITPVADPDGRDRNVDWFYKTRETAQGEGARVQGARVRRVLSARVRGVRRVRGCAGCGGCEGCGRVRGVRRVRRVRVRRSRRRAADAAGREFRTGASTSITTTIAT